MPVSFLKLDSKVSGRRIFDRETTQTVMGMLEKVVSSEGTARLASVDGYRVAGKTGTVHKAENGSYADNRYFSLFAGLAPASAPRYAIVVIIDDPRHGDYFGGQVAAPLFSRIASNLLRITNIIPDQKSNNDLQMLFAEDVHP